jgi:REP element-mobilizing transposase RayT
MNKYNLNIHHRRSIRLKGYDYSKEGLYFLTFCCQNREYFSTVGASLVGAQPSYLSIQTELNDAGKMIEAEWLSLQDRFPNIRLHEFVVMPNHFHGILEIVEVTLVVARKHQVVKKEDSDIENGHPRGDAPTKNKTIADIVDVFKSITTVKYIHGVKTKGWKRFSEKLWQRDYYEHIIRNETALNNIANYIIDNPRKWNEDRFNS